MSQRTTKPTIRLMRPAKTQISLCIRAVWSESSLISCASLSLRAIERGINEKPRHTGWMYRLIWVFIGHTDLIIGFVMRSLIYLSRGTAFPTRLLLCPVKTEISLSMCRALLWLPSIQSVITKTYLYNFDPLKPSFYIIKMVFTGVHYFSYFCSKT